MSAGPSNPIMGANLGLLVRRLHDELRVTERKMEEFLGYTQGLHVSHDADHLKVMADLVTTSAWVTDTFASRLSDRVVHLSDYSQNSGVLNLEDTLTAIRAAQDLLSSLRRSIHRAEVQANRSETVNADVAEGLRDDIRLTGRLYDGVNETLRSCIEHLRRSANDATRTDNSIENAPQLLDHPNLKSVQELQDINDPEEWKGQLLRSRYSTNSQALRILDLEADIQSLETQMREAAPLVRDEEIGALMQQLTNNEAELVRYRAREVAAAPLLRQANDIIVDFRQQIADRDAEIERLRNGDRILIDLTRQEAQMAQLTRRLETVQIQLSPPEFQPGAGPPGTGRTAFRERYWQALDEIVHGDLQPHPNPMDEDAV